jgi:hypothetical protein
VATAGLLPAFETQEADRGDECAKLVGTQPMHQAELVIQYNNWKVTVSDEKGVVVAELKCERNKWFSGKYSGNGFTGTVKFSVKSASKKITLAEDGDEIGTIDISHNEWFHNFATIDLNGVKFSFRRKSLALDYELAHTGTAIIGKVTGFTDRKHQSNLFGLIYFSTKCHFSVAMNNEILPDKKFLQLLLACGYCMILFDHDL